MLHWPIRSVQAHVNMSGDGSVSPVYLRNTGVSSHAYHVESEGGGDAGDRGRLLGRVNTFCDVTVQLTQSATVLRNVTH